LVLERRILRAGSSWHRRIGALLFFGSALAFWPSQSAFSANAPRTSTAADSAEEQEPEEEPFDDSVFDDDVKSHRESDTAESPGTPFSRNAQFIEAVEIVGNEKTSRQVILHRLLVAVGDLIDENKIEESRLRLLNTGYFKSVEFSLRRGSHRGKVLLVVEVVERNTILIDQLYLGFSPVVPFYGGFGIVESNFLGKGVTAGAAFVAGKDRRAVEVKLFVPNLSDTPLQLSASGILLRGAEVIDPSNPSAYQLTYKRVGGTLGLGFGVGPAQRVSLDYRLESVQADRLPNLDPAILRRAPQIQFDESVLSTLSLTYERDTRDDPFVPTQGGRIALGVEAGTKLLGSSYEFSKYYAEFQQAFLMFEKHSLIVRAVGGFVQGSTPFFNQFWASDYVYFAVKRHSLPRAVQLNFSPSNDYDDLLVSAGAEYVVPFHDGGDFLYRAFFFGGVDVTATASLDEVQEDPSGRGVGGYFPLSFDAGLKFDTAVGNFTLSVAYLANLILL
jgi:outer membrane protein insertion porin family